MTFWHLLMEIVLLLSTAFVLGAVTQRLKESAIIVIGYGRRGDRSVKPCATMEWSPAPHWLDTWKRSISTDFI